MRILHLGWGFRPWRGGGLIAYAEDVMEEQASHGHDVAYFMAGRHFRGLRRPRLRRWQRDGVAMFEVINSPVPVAVDLGTHSPELELDEPHTERMFAEVLAAFQPDVVHIQELAGVPTSLIDLAADRRIPMVMTLQDYFPLCPTIKLYDADGEICMRTDPAPVCVRCCRDAPDTNANLVALTDAYYLQRLGHTFPRLRAAARRTAGFLWRFLPTGATGLDPPATPEIQAPVSSYQLRRDRNVERLNRVDAIVAMSHRVAEIYEHLGVDAERLRTVHLAVRHVQDLRPRHIDQPPAKVRFSTLNGANSVQKGARVVRDAVRRLDADGFGDRYELHVHGYAIDEVREELDRHPAVSLEGEYRPAALDQVLEDADVGIVPSIWEEAYGYTGIEYLAKGVPVIGNARGGITDYTIPGETGWLNTDASGDGLAAAMAHVIEHPEEIPLLHGHILERRDEFVKPLGRHLAELDEIYRTAVARRPRVAR